MNQYSYTVPNGKFKPNNSYPINNNGDRFVGGFFGPFLLGGITGGLLAPAFYPRPIYGPPIYRPYPVYNQPYVTNQYFY